MKKLLALLLALVMVLSFAACSNNEEPVDDQSQNESEESNNSSEEEENEEPAAETYKLGMGVVVSTSSSKEGTAQVDTTIAVVVTDSEGKIVKCELDCAMNVLSIEGGLVPEDLSAVELRTKQEKKEDYGMSKIGAVEWYIQADAFAAGVVGMTADEIAAHAGSEEALVAECTMHTNAFEAAIIKACNDEYAKEFSADSFTVGLGVVNNFEDSESASAEKNGSAKLYSTFAGVVLAEDGSIIVDLIDAVQPVVEFDTNGAIVTVSADYDASFRSKKELKEDYGMAAIMNTNEWYEQALAFETYVEGMTATQVSGIETTTTDHGYVVGVDEALTAGCTIQISDFMGCVAKACANAR